MPDQSKQNNGSKQGITTPKSDTERILVEVPELIVDYFLILILFPRRPEHIGSLTIWMKQSLAKDLWALSEADDMKARIQANVSSEDRAKAIQKLHHRKTPDAKVLKNMSSQEGLAAPTQVHWAQCMNLDLNPKGKSTNRNDPHDKYDIQHEWIFKIPTYDNSTFMYSEEPAYGHFPRLRMVRTKDNADEDNLARIHCGREWRHSHLANNLSNGHLIMDTDGEWSELTGTHGCIRVSLLSMRELFTALGPISNMDFEWNEAPEDPKTGKLPYDTSTRGRRRHTLKKPSRPDAVGFIYAEEHTDENWCCGSAEQAVVEMAGRQSSSRIVSVCESTTWSAADFVAFHKSRKMNGFLWRDPYIFMG